MLNIPKDAAKKSSDQGSKLWCVLVKDGPDVDSNDVRDIYVWGDEAVVRDGTLMITRNGGVLNCAYARGYWASVIQVKFEPGKDEPVAPSIWEP